MKHPLTALLASGALMCMSSAASAVETGLSIYPKGMADFMSGVVPPEPGFYFSNIYYYMNGSAGTAVRNGVTEVGLEMTLNADFMRGTYVTDTKILGGTYALGAAIAVAGADLNASLVGPAAAVNAHVSNSGFADSIISPLLLGWHDGNLHWNVGLNVYVPTGAYNKGELNLGRNIWGFMPQFGLTWFDPASGWDVSGALVYVSMTNNDATDYQSGDILHLDWAIGKHFGKGWEIGVAGNVVQQVGADRGTGALLGAFKADSVGIGPAVNYTTAYGKTPLIFAAKWERDIEAHRTFSGDVITASLTIAF